MDEIRIAEQVLVGLLALESTGLLEVHRSVARPAVRPAGPDRDAADDPSAAREQL